MRRTRRPRIDDELTASPWRPLDPTSQAVALAVLRHGPIARADLARSLELSTPSLTRIVRQLVDSGIVIELAPTQIARTGRPSLPLSIDPRRAAFLGVKVVAGAVYAVVCDLAGQVLRSSVEPLRATDPTSVVTTIARIAEAESAGDTELSGIGVALAGVIEDRTVRTARFLQWDEPVAFAALVEEATGLPCSVDNDVRAFTVAEHWFGAGRGLTSFAVITVGLGVGCGLIIDDELVVGPHGRAGMVGHVLVDPDGPPCYENHRGCAFMIMGSDQLADRFSAALGRAVEFAEGVELAATVPEIEAILRHASRCLGRLVGHVANISDPERILLSGDGVGWVVADELQRGQDETRYDGVAATPVVIQQIDFFEWAHGAAAQAIRRHVLG